MIERIAQHFQGRWLQGYVRGKLRSDPVYAAAFEMLKDDPRPVVDLGCGIGLFEFYLRERGYTEPISGVDFDKRKITTAQCVATRYEGLNFVARDLAGDHGGHVFEGATGHVALFDLLHYLPEQAQRRLLDYVAAHVGPGAFCLIRATPRDASWRFRLTQFEELLLSGLRWMKSGAAHYLTTDEILARFRARGFVCEVRPLWGRTPFNSHLFAFRNASESRVAGTDSNSTIA